MNCRWFFLALLLGTALSVEAQLAVLSTDPPKPKKKLEYHLERMDKRVNSPFHEGAPVISTDGSILYFFVADHPDNKHGTKGSQDIWFSERTGSGKWGDAVHMPAPLNQNRYNQVMSVINDGNTLLVRGKGTKSSEGFSIAHRNFNGWDAPIPLRIRDYDTMRKGVYSGGILNQSGNVLLLYFSELKDEKISDLYVSFKQEDRSWSKPKYIEALNTAHDEFGPSLDPNGNTLYFASTRPGGHGSSDIYVTKRLDDTWLNWSDPINLGAPINTSGFDAYYSVDDKGNVFTTRAYMSPDGGSLDILTLIPVEKPKPMLTVWGFVFDQETKDPVSASVKYEIHQLTAGEAVSDANDGFYEVKIAADGEYQILSTSEGYLNETESLLIPEIESDTVIQKDIYLDKIEIGSTVRLNNIFFDFDKTTLRPESVTELNMVVDFLKDNPSVKVEIAGHTDSKGSDAYNFNLSDGRAGAVRSFLLENWIEPDRVTSQGYGESKPVANNQSDEGRQRNRRVEFTILER